MTVNFTTWKGITDGQRYEIPDSEHYHPGNEGSGTLINDEIGGADLTLDKDNWRDVSDFEGGVGFEVNDGDNIGTVDIGTPSERTLIVRVFADSFHGGNQSNLWSYGGDGDPDLHYYEDVTDWRYDTPSDRLIVSESTWAGEIRIVATRIDSSEANLDVWEGDKSKVGDDAVSNPDTSYDNEGADFHLGEGEGGVRFWDGVIDPNMITFNRRLSDSELNDVIQEFF